MLTEPFLNLLFAIIVAVTSARVTVRLSLKKFRTERWWELKVEAYQRLFDALYDTDVVWKQLIKEELVGIDQDNEVADMIKARARDAGDIIDRAIFHGAFILDNQAVELIRSLGRGLRMEEMAKMFKPKMGNPIDEWANK